jgi:hypothetical protein
MPLDPHWFGSLDPGSALKPMRMHNTELFSQFLPSVLLSYHQYQCCRSESGRIRKFLPNPKKNHSLSGQPGSGAETPFQFRSGAEKNHAGFTPLDQNPVISCSHKKMKYSTLTGSFSYDGINEFLRDLSYGKGRTNPVKGQPSRSVSLRI